MIKILDMKKYNNFM